MAIIIKTNDSQKLASEIREKMNGYTIPSWIIDTDGDITLTNDKWNNKAWFRLIQHEDNLTLGIISSRKYIMTKEIYGVFHGRLTATLLAYFDTLISSITSTSMPTDDDCI